jgi:hypothetical protein
MIVSTTSSAGHRSSSKPRLLATFTNSFIWLQNVRGRHSKNFLLQRSEVFLAMYPIHCRFNNQQITKIFQPQAMHAMNTFIYTTRTSVCKQDVLELSVAKSDEEVSSKSQRDKLVDYVLRRG